MKKMIILLVVLLLTCGSALITITTIVNAEKSRVNYEQNILIGNYSQIEGLSVSFSCDLKENLFWDITCKLGEEAKANSSFHFSRKAVHDDTLVGSIDMSVDFSAYLSKVMSNQTDNPQLKAHIEEFGLSMENGSEKTLVVDISKYVDYYPFWAMVSIGDTGASWDGAEHWEDPLFEGTVEQFQKFFRIPVVDGHVLELVIEKDMEGKCHIGTVGSHGDDQGIYLWTESLITSDACYFIFPLEGDAGDLVDFGQVPGGYGLYRLNYRVDEMEQVHIDENALELAFSLSQTEEFCTMHVDENEKTLYMVTYNENEYDLWLYVIDMENMQLMQRLNVYNSNQNPLWYAETFIYEDFIVLDFYKYFMETDSNGEYTDEVEDSKEYFTLLTKGEDGKFKNEMIVPALTDEVEKENPYFYMRDARSWCWNGEQLVLTGMLTDSKRESNGNFYIAVYEEDCVVHFSEYISSLHTGYSPNDYHYSCHLDEKSNRVFWEN